MDSIKVVGLNVSEAGRERIEAFVDFGLGRRSHGSNGSAMEGFIEGDDIVAPTGLPESARKFDEPVIRFRSGVGEEDLARMSDDLFDNEFGKVSLLLDVVEIRTMHQGR